MHIVKRIIFSDFDFKPLMSQLDKSDFIRIYNRCYSRLRKRGVEKNKINAFINDEIRSELYKLLPKKEIEITTDAEIKERQESQQPIRKKYVKMHGVRLWSDEPTTDDKIESLKQSYNQSVEKTFNEVFCPRCMSNPCVCRYEES